MSKISEMFEMKDQLNKQIHPDWKNQPYDWNRAIWVECAELMDKIGWKWWKKQELDREQAVLELVDIWHFIMSEVISVGFINELPKHDLNVLDPLPLLRLIENMAHAAISKRIDWVVQHFFTILAKPEVDLSIDELFKLYAGKFTLNAFRQDNGYKEGTYQKVWLDGREDNEHLMDIINMYSDSDDFMADVYSGLHRIYHASSSVLIY